MVVRACYDRARLRCELMPGVHLTYVGAYSETHSPGIKCAVGRISWISSRQKCGFSAD